MNKIQADSDKAEGHPGDKQIIVGIGASAGGLEALQAFFKAMPTDSGLAFVVIQHLSPDFKSMMDELLARYTPMDIHVATDGMAIQPDSIYLIPPRKSLSVFHNKLYLEDQNPKKGLNLPVDIFFRSLAADKGRQAIGVVLSGTGSDGTLGARAIKEAGGMLMVQDDQTAKFDGMPRNVIATGLVDYILEPGQMPQELVRYTKHPFVSRGQLRDSMQSKDIDTLTKIILVLRDFSGIDFSYYKENTIIRRLERRVSINQFDNLEDYLEFLSESNKEKDILYREMLIGVTRFFRDEEAFHHLRKDVLQELVVRDKKQIRVWSVGCSSGEEVYSLAMLMHEVMEQADNGCECKIFATDIDRRALDVASQGFYPESIAADVDASYLAKYFSRRDHGYQVNETIRRMIVFATHNLLKDPPFSRLDLIVCRNLFIYLKPDVQSKMLSVFYNSMNPGSFLFMGSSETIGNMGEAFESMNFKWKIYRHKPGYKPPLFQHLPSLQGHPSADNRRGPGQKTAAEKNRFDNLWNDLLDAFVPPSVVIDQQDNIIHVINDTTDFLRAQPGQFSQNLFDNLPRELSLLVSAQLRKLKRSNRPVSIDNVSGIKGYEGRKVSIQGRVLLAGKQPYYLLSFLSGAELADVVPQEAGMHDLDRHALERVGELEKELQYTRENLQATVEELETSNEELQSSNEELIASNEELQSTNEELQSVNEELYTVNSEYQNKIEELSRLNNDLNNLLNNTEVGALYLDSRLCIRKFTPVIHKITNIRDHDIGRPLSHITVMDGYPAIFDDIMQVSETLQPVDREVQADEVVYFCRIRPYRSDQHAVDGILLTFVDITALKDAQEDLRRNQEVLGKVLDNSPLAKVLVDDRGQITYANKPAETLFGITRQQIIDRTYDAASWKITNLEGKPIPAEELPFAIIKKTMQPMYGFEHYIQVKNRKKVLLSITGAPLIDQNGAFEGAVFAIQQKHE